ncbi:hypothetical protein HO173_000722 [Letharia columbiana]|uniref:Uncharacterized protein n=1 Tax=Letharia columbiana TaxID=112416 RepID=A0A8H6G5G2_9LECA|nr:uncharacterized protein HO173_000722 [Letharia columbiana]KAF6240930.1 hypothetical protein HO173_000722 [Letharia columbiana]
MSTPTQTRPVITIYPSPQEDVSAYLAAIRLASSVRNSMDAQKAGVDGEEAAVYADSWGRHHPNFPPPPSPTPGGREPVQILNETSSADFASNTTKPGFVHPRDRYPSPSRSLSTADSPTGATLEALKRHHGHFPPPDPPMSTGTGPILEDEAANTPAGVKLEALEQHHGHFPPPDPPMSAGTGPILEDEAANTPTGIKLEALEQHHGIFHHQILL